MRVILSPEKVKEMGDVELDGSEECTIYQLNFVGGPKDGEITNAFRPYFAFCTEDNSVYVAEDKNNHLEWVNDFTYRIFLRHRPDLKWDDFIKED